jgi:hypothetical protein
MKIDRRSVALSLAAVGLDVATSHAYAQGQPAASPAEWLVMYYMNGKNNLVQDALDDFGEMAKVGSTDKVTVVAQLGRPMMANPPSHDGWSGVKRYRIDKNTVPTVKDALMHVGDAKSPTGDMGSPATLDAFIEWAASTFPAKRRILVIWNHGQGWRFQMAASDVRYAAASRALTAAETAAVADAPVMGTYRSVSSDDDNRSILYNKQVQTVLEAKVAKGIRFDIVAYDACLMSMVETAYSLRRCTDFLVGSQELEPGAGWDHTLVLEKLAKSPSMSPEQFATAIVKSYQEKYGDFNLTTLSATRLSAIGPACQAISEVSKSIRANAAASFPALRNVRAGMKAFADYQGVGFAVDSQTLFERLAAASANAAVKSRANAAANAMKAANVANYASAQVKAYTPLGLALYFPKTKGDFERDGDRAGYQRSNKVHPVDFVNDNEWALVLKDLLKLPA